MTSGPREDRSMDTVLPGVSGLDPVLIRRFEQAREARGDGYRPRTKHLRPDGFAKYTNRLFLETSPSLLPHAHNPVNWYPWGDGGFVCGGRLRGVRRPCDGEPERVTEIGRNLTMYIQQPLSLEGGKDLPAADILATAARFYRGRFVP